jgi:putative hydrolase of the HAD superfamily
MYSLMCRRLGIEEDAARLARRVYDEFGKPERWAVYADVLPALDRLRVLGLRLGIISNWDGRLVGLLGALGVRERVDVVLSSADVGLRKPDPRIFELACERLGVVPSEAAHVGDHHYSDILGARAVGMTPVLVDRSGRPSLPVGPVPITDFDSLETVLGLS